MLYLVHLSGRLYLVVALVLGLGLCLQALQLSRGLQGSGDVLIPLSRNLLLASIIYLPALLAAALISRTG